MKTFFFLAWAFIATPAAALAAKAWALMLVVGAIHHEWFPALPTLGYWQAVAIVTPVILAALIWTAVLMVNKALDD